MQYSDDGAYVGGTLAEQIASRAHTIQIVRARARHLMATHYPRVEAYWFGREWPRRAGFWRDRRRDIYVFELEVEATLKGGGQPPDRPILVRAIDGRRDPQLWLSFEHMLHAQLDRPGRDGFAWNLAAVDPDSETSCHVALAMRVGERYLVLRDERGDVLSPQFDWNRTEFERYLPIDVAFTQQDGERRQFTVWAPGVLRMDSSATELAARIRTALAE